MSRSDATRLSVQLVPGYMKLDKTTGCMVPTYPPAAPLRASAPLGPIVSLAAALRDTFEADEPNYRWYRDGRCYLMQCSPHPNRPGSSQGPRLAGNAWELQPIVMQLVLTDVDASGKKEPGFDSATWWGQQQGAIAGFLQEHPEAFIASSRGGLRIYQVLDTPFRIDCKERVSEWKARYEAWVAHVRGFPWVGAAQGGADELKDWTRLQRIPHDTRDGVLQLLPTIGDPARVGLVELPPPLVSPAPDFIAYGGPFVEAHVTTGLIARVAEVLPRQGDGVHDCAFALGGIMSMSHWALEDCVQMVVHCFAAAGIQREDIARTAESSVQNARAGGRAYGWRRFVQLCGGDWRADNVCWLLRQNIPGLDPVRIG